MKIFPYAVISITMAVVYCYAAVRANQLLSKLRKETEIILPFSNRRKFIELKELCKRTNGTALETDANKLLLFMNLSVYTVYVGFTLFVLLMIFGI